MSDIINIIFSKEVLTPFFSTIAGASTVIIIQFISNFFKEKNKKLYAINYIIYTYTKILHSQLILKTLTIQPHIDAVKRMLEGDDELLSKTFLADEFDILIERSINFNLLPDEYKILIAQDHLDCVQMYELICQLLINSKSKDNLNQFVKDNLKIEAEFRAKSEEDQQSILFAYWDYMDKIKHDTDRCISFILDQALPALKKYKDNKQFLLFSKKSINKNLKNLNEIQEHYRGDLPEKDYIFKNATGGVRKLL